MSLNENRIVTKRDGKMNAQTMKLQVQTEMDAILAEALFLGVENEQDIAKLYPEFLILKGEYEDCESRILAELLAEDTCPPDRVMAPCDSAADKLETHCTSADVKLSQKSPKKGKCVICLEAIYEDASNTSLMPSHKFSCQHSYCAPCVRDLADFASKDKSQLPLKCAVPKCNAPIPVANQTFKSLTEPYPTSNDNESLLQKIVRMTEVVLDPHPFQCPNSRCGASFSGKNRSACPVCKEVICKKCRKKSHPDITCKEHERRELSKINKLPEDLQMFSLVEKSKWRKCPNCGFIVQKSSGCNHMSCICHTEFCYACGGLWSMGTCHDRCHRL